MVVGSYYMIRPWFKPKPVHGRFMPVKVKSMGRFMVSLACGLVIGLQVRRHVGKAGMKLGLQASQLAGQLASFMAGCLADSQEAYRGLRGEGVGYELFGVAGSQVVALGPCVGGLALAISNWGKDITMSCLRTHLNNVT